MLQVLEHLQSFGHFINYSLFQYNLSKLIQFCLFRRFVIIVWLHADSKTSKMTVISIPHFISSFVIVVYKVGNGPRYKFVVGLGHSRTKKLCQWCN